MTSKGPFQSKAFYEGQQGLGKQGHRRRPLEGRVLTFVEAKTG